MPNFAPTLTTLNTYSAKKNLASTFNNQIGMAAIVISCLYAIKLETCLKNLRMFSDPTIPFQIIAIEKEMEHPKDYLGWFGILNISSVVSLTVYATFGFFGYWHFGCTVYGSITLNLPPAAM